jgi:hypothetical protein
MAGAWRKAIRERQLGEEGKREGRDPQRVQWVEEGDEREGGNWSWECGKRSV